MLSFEYFEIGEGPLQQSMYHLCQSNSLVEEAGVDIDTGLMVFNLDLRIDPEIVKFVAHVFFSGKQDI